ncbi:hypothetical protein K4F52_001200 [Lecanicillium sp. MT-2017a]|nr:hypothetical protein K4F52_001200 [Lecanicillium sp. MT-2017a]
MINKVIDFEQSKLRQRTSVRAGIDKKLDELKRQYDGMESFLTEVVNHISSASPAWASKHIRSCIFLPQLGFLTVVDTDESGNSKYEGEGGTGSTWEKIFVSDCAACYKNDQMRELDSRYGDMYCEIGDKILTRMSTAESVSENESAFAIDLRQTLQAIRLLTPKSLVLIDEFGKGTCSVNGAGLMAGLLDHLMSLGCDSRPTSLIATHFHEIFDGNYVTGDDEIQFARMDVRVDLGARGTDDQVTYLFQVSPGRSVSSFGTQCAARNGMPKSIVERAEAISLLISRNEDLAAFCARLSEEEEARLEAAEAIARRFVGHDMHGWEASSVNNAKTMIEDLFSVRSTSLCLSEQGE